MNEDLEDLTTPFEDPARHRVWLWAREGNSRTKSRGGKKASQTVVSQLGKLADKMVTFNIFLALNFFWIVYYKYLLQLLYNRKS